MESIAIQRSSTGHSIFTSTFRQDEEVGRAFLAFDLHCHYDRTRIRINYLYSTHNAMRKGCSFFASLFNRESLRSLLLLFSF